MSFDPIKLGMYALVALIILITLVSNPSLLDSIFNTAQVICNIDDRIYNVAYNALDDTKAQSILEAARNGQEITQVDANYLKSKLSNLRHPIYADLACRVIGG